MTFAARLIHSLTIVRTTFDDDEAARDDRGQPAATTEEIEARGLVQPRSAREVADARSAGAELGDHVVFLEPITLLPTDALVWNDTGRRLEVVGIRSFLIGRTPHHEVDAQTVRTTPIAEVAS